MRTKTRKILALDPLRAIPEPGCHAHRAGALTPWFEWAHDRALICPATDLSQAAELIAEHLSDRD